MGFAIRQRGRTATAARAEEDRAAGNTAADERPVRSARPGAAARGAAAASSFMLAVARVVRLVTWIVVLIIVAGILLRVLDANSTNTIVRHIHDAAKTLVGPF